jgi:hypothetical protein
MTGEPLQGRDHDETTPLPPTVRPRRVDERDDAALTGAPLPPFHRGLPAVRWYGAGSTADEGAEAAPAAPAWDEAGHEQEEIDAWEARRAAWDAEFAPAEEETVDGAGWDAELAPAAEETADSAAWDAELAPAAEETADSAARDAELDTPEGASADQAAPAPPWGGAETPASGALESRAPTAKPWGGDDEPVYAPEPIAFDAGPTSTDAIEPTAFDVGPSGGEDIVAGEPPWAEEDLEATAALDAELEPAAPSGAESEAWSDSEPSPPEPEPWSEVDLADEGWARAVEEAEAGMHAPEPVAPGWDDSWSGAGEPNALELPAGTASEPVEAAAERVEAAGEPEGEQVQPVAGAAAEPPAVAAAEPVEVAAEADTRAPAEPAVDEGVDEWLAGGVAEAFPWDAAAEAAASLASDADDEGAEAPSAPAPAEAGADEPPVWEAWEPEDEAAPLPADAAADAWAADRDAFAAAGSEEEDAAAASPAGDATETAPTEDEIVARMPATPLDAWYHADAAAGASETWEAFGRALEEAASWGDLGSTIATGLPPEQQQTGAAAPGEARAETSTEPTPVDGTDEAPSRFATETPDDAAEPPAETAAAAPAAAGTGSGAAGTPPTPATGLPFEDLAGRLEQLARRLRAEGGKGVEHALSEGDRLEASLAGFIAGYVAARRE